MHYLLIPYALLSFLFLVLYQSRAEGGSRGALGMISFLVGVILFGAMLLRPVQGDSWRYYQSFLHMRQLDFSQALDEYGKDPLFAVLNWIVGQLGESEVWLFGGTLVIYWGLFFFALRRLLSPLAVVTVFMSYVAYPFFVAYAANGLRQGLAMAFMLMALIGFSKREKSAWVWLALIPFWHSGSVLASLVIGGHQLMLRAVRNESLRWRIVFSVLLGAIGLSASGLNETLLGRLPDTVELQREHAVYFSDPEVVEYRSGFRPDFLLFSLLPVASALALRGKAGVFDYRGSGWWLSVYLALNVIYHLFAFAPYSDRFAGFSWFLMPLVVFLQIQETQRETLLNSFVVVVMFVNIIMLQFYTGNFIHPPTW